jgi:hypothetical protein
MPKGTELHFPPPGQPVAVLKGKSLLTQHELIARSRLLADEAASTPVLSELLPRAARPHGILIEGMPGTGKGLIINQLKLSDLQLLMLGHPVRLFIWNYKGDEFQFLESLELPVRPNYLNPADVRGVGVNIAAEVTGRLEAIQFAAEIYQPDADPQGHNYDWVMATRSTLAEVIQVAQKNAPLRWRFIDILFACLTKENLQPVLEQSVLGKAFLQGLFGGDDQAASVFFGLQNLAQSLWPIASAMVHTRNIRLRDWISGKEPILVLPNVNAYRHALAPFHRWVMSRVLDLVLDLPRATSEQFNFYIDEARHSPFGSNLTRLMTLGRENGAGIVAAIQSESGLEDALGPKKAEEFIGCFATQVFMKTNESKMQERHSKAFGKHDVLMPEYSISSTKSWNTNAGNMTEREKHAAVAEHLDERAMERAKTGTVRQRPQAPHSTDHGWGSTTTYPKLQNIDDKLFNKHGVIPSGCPISDTTTTSESLTVNFREQERPLVKEIEFDDLPKAEMRPGQGLVVEAFIKSTFLGKSKQVATHMDEEGVCLHPVQSVQKHIPRPEEQLHFQGWTAADKKRLGITN